MRVVLFDIDGTLLRGGGLGIRASERAFLEHFNQPNAWGELLPDGKTDPIIFQEIAGRILGRNLTDDELRGVTFSYLRNLEHEITDAPNFRVLPGVRELLHHLGESREFFIGIETGNLRRAADLKLAKAELQHFFKTGGFACDSPQRAKIVQTAIERASSLLGRSVQPETVVVIGDAPQDIEAARANGCKIVSVATGRLAKQELEQLKPDTVLDNLEGVHEVRALLEVLSTI